jgi:hypothetical protein
LVGGQTRDSDVVLEAHHLAVAPKDGILQRLHPNPLVDSLKKFTTSRGKKIPLVKKKKK